MTKLQVQHDTPDLALQLKYCRRLPTLPTIALRLVELADDNSATLDQFAEIVAYDPALTGKLLRVANSAFYGSRKTVSSLTQAMNLLGLNATIALSLSFSLRQSVSKQHSPDFDATLYWRRALLTALASQTIAAELNEAQPEDFLLAGLLQDIGVLAMDAIFGDDYTLVCQQSNSHEDLLAQETIRFGFDHAQVGAQLLREWGLPDRVSNCVWLSHDTSMLTDENNTDTERLATFVAGAAHLADAWLAEQATPGALEAAQDAARSILKINPDQYQRIIASMAQEMPEMGELFDMQLVPPFVIQGVEDSAIEILAARNLQLSQLLDSSNSQAQGLETRVATLETQTQRDTLTGLYNRAYLERTLEQKFAQATNERRPLSLVFIDVDRFKAVNDTFGHAVGDQVLTLVAQRLSAEARQTDTVARYGGEEFVVLLAETSASQAEAIVQRMLASVRDTPFQTRSGASGTLSFSAGIATHMEGKQSFKSSAALLRAADDTLYAVKEVGRGRVVLYRPEER